MAWAVAQKVERPADKLVLLGLADRHNTEYACAYPSVAWLCEFSGLDRKTVNSAMGRLQARGLIRDSGRRIGVTKQVKAYQLALDGAFETCPKTDILIEEIGPKTDTLKTSETGHLTGVKTSESGHLKGVKTSVFPYKDVRKRTTEPIKEPVNDANASLKSAASKNQNAVLPDWLPREAWDGFVAMRRSIKAPLTPKAQSLAIAKLADLARAGHDPGKVLEQSILNSWRGLFELKGNRHERNGSPIQRGRHPALDILAEAEAADDDADYRGVGPALSAVGW